MLLDLAPIGTGGLDDPVVHCLLVAVGLVLLVFVWWRRSRKQDR